MAIPRWIISFRNAVAHAVVILLISLVRLLSARATFALGRILSLLVWNSFPRWRRTTLRNLELFYSHQPEADKPTPEQLREIGRASAINLGYHVMEFIRMGFLPIERALEMVTEVEGLEYYTAALAQGRGAIGLAMHFGNWEMSGAYLSQRVKPLYAVGKEQRDEFFTKLVFPWRTRFGIHNIYAGHKVNSLVLRALKENCILGLVADQNGGSRGIFAPFCGIQASTPAGPAVLALKTGAPILLTVCLRKGPGQLKLIVKPPLDMTGLPADKEAAIVEVLTRVNAVYEAMILEAPENWLWGHKRWKTRPAGEPRLY